MSLSLSLKTTKSDYFKLVRYIDSNADTSFSAGLISPSASGMLKKNDALWTINTGNTNSTGFSALPGGIRIWDGSFAVTRFATMFWAATA